MYVISTPDPAEHNAVAAPPTTAQTGVQAVHRPILAVDVVASGRYSTRLQLHTRGALYSIAQSACAAVGISWAASHHEDRGDGILLIPPSEVSAELLLGLFVGHLRAGIRRHNQTASPDACMRLRVAVHAGYVCLDGHGAAGRSVTHLFRLLDAPQFRTIVQVEHVEFGLIISNYLYNEVVQDAPGFIDPGLYRPLAIANKETREMAWVLLPFAHLPQYDAGHAEMSPIAAPDDAASNTFQAQVDPRLLLPHGWGPE